MDVLGLRLSAMRALWGIITPKVRKMSIEENSNEICLFFYYDTEPSEEEVELSEEAATEVIADFPEPYTINCKRYVIKYPERIQCQGFLIYSRFEPTPSDA